MQPIPPLPIKICACLGVIQILLGHENNLATHNLLSCMRLPDMDPWDPVASDAKCRSSSPATGSSHAGLSAAACEIALHANRCVGMRVEPKMPHNKGKPLPVHYIFKRESILVVSISPSLRTACILSSDTGMFMPITANSALFLTSWLASSSALTKTSAASLAFR